MEYLSDGGCTVLGVGLGTSSDDGRLQPPGAFRTRVIQSTVTRAYQWGSLTCSYSASNDQVRIGINVTNTTPYEIRGLILKVAGLAVQMPANRAMLRLTPTKHNLEGPDIISLTRGDITVLVANEELAKFLDLEVQQAPGGVAVVLNTQMQARLMPARLAHFGTQMRQLAVTRRSQSA